MTSSLVCTSAIDAKVLLIQSELESRRTYTEVFEWVWVARLTPLEFPSEIAPLLTKLRDARIVVCGITLAEYIVITVGYADRVTEMTHDEMFNHLHAWRNHERSVIERLKSRGPSE